MSKGMTIRKIAELAGVSKTSVSFYLNGRAEEFRISAETCRKIEAVIKEHNYRPNLSARAMAKKQTFLLGVISRDFPNSSFRNDIIAGIEQEIEKKDYHMVLGTSNEDLEREKKLFKFMVEKGVDGFIIDPIVGEDGSNIDHLKELAQGRPVVSILYPVNNVPSVYTDNLEGGRIAARHFLEMGHSKVAYIGAVTASLQDRRDERYIGYCDALQDAGIQPDVFSHVSSFMPKINDYTAVFCYGSCELLELYDQAKNNGIRIPDDISIMPFGVHDYFKYITPKPTAVFEYKSEIGVQAGNILMNLLGSSKSASVPDEKMMPYLIDGKSVRRVV